MAATTPAGAFKTTKAEAVTSSSVSTTPSRTPPTIRRLPTGKRKPVVPRTAQLLLGIYLLAILSVFVVRYNVTLLDTVDLAARALLLDDEHWSLPLVFSSPSKTTTTPTTVPKIAFVHVGKTGGTTIGSFLRVTCEARTKAASRDYCLQEWRAKHTLENGTNTTDESQVSQHTFGVVHGTQSYPHANPHQVLQEATHVMISLRNPIERVVSWFYYMHPLNCYDGSNNDASDNASNTPRTRQPFTLPDKACITKRHLTQSTTSRAYLFYQTCFPTINDFAHAVVVVGTHPHGQPDDNIDKQCRQLAQETLAGDGGPNGLAGHLWANYTYYYHQLLLWLGESMSHHVIQKPLLVVRTDHLYEDLQRIDQQVLHGKGQVFAWQQQQQQQQQRRGGNSPTTTSSSSSSASIQIPAYHKDVLSPNGYTNLCCALQDELQVYQQFLQAAINLSPEQQQTTLVEELLETCGASAAASTTDDDNSSSMVLLSSLQDLKDYCRSTATARRERK